MLKREREKNYKDDPSLNRWYEPEKDREAEKKLLEDILEKKFKEEEEQKKK